MKWTYMDEVQKNGFLNNMMMKQEINLLNFILQNEQRDIKSEGFSEEMKRKRSSFPSSSV